MNHKRTKKTFKSVISGALNSADIFEQPIHFNMDGQKSLTSALGGFVSLGIVIFLATQAITQTVQMFSRDGPQIIQINGYEEDPERIYLNNTNNFIFAVSTSVNNKNVNMSENSVLSFTSTYAQQIRSIDGSVTKYKSKILWAPCNESNFPPHIFPKGTFKTYSLNYAFCPTAINFTDTTSGQCPEKIKKEYPDCITPPYFVVGGTFLSLNFEYIQFKLKLCDQEDSKYVTGLKCIKCMTGNTNSTFKNSEVKLNLYYTNNLVDSVNYQMPNSSFLDTIYWNIHPSVSKLADIFIDKGTVQDFDNYFSGDSHHNQSFYSIPAEKMRELEVFQGNSLLEWNLRRSNINHVTRRIYIKLLDVISNVGGLSELLLVIGALLVVGYTRYKYQMILSNELYDFEPVEQKKAPQKVTPDVSPLSTITIQTTEPSSSKSFTHSFSKAFNFNTKKANDEKIKNYFDFLKLKKRHLPSSLLNYLKELFTCLCKRGPEEQLAYKARKHILNDLDIMKVIEKLKEIDKLKKIILNKHQREAFNFIEKPLITLKEEDSASKAPPLSLDTPKDQEINEEGSKLFNPREEYDSISKYSKLYLSYRCIKSDINPANHRNNRKLLEMMGEDLINVFQQVDQKMGSLPDTRRFEQIIRRIESERLEAETN